MIRFPSRRSEDVLWWSATTLHSFGGSCPPLPKGHSNPSDDECLQERELAWISRHGFRRCFPRGGMRTRVAGGAASASARCFRPSNMRRVIRNPAGSITYVARRAHKLRARTRR